MNQSLPKDHELLTTDFLRKFGAVGGLKYCNNEEDIWRDCNWSFSQIQSVGLDAFSYYAPIGTTAMYSTPLPEVRCVRYPLCTYHPTVHDDKCPAHPSNALVKVLPGWLNALDKKPEGLIVNLGIAWNYKWTTVDTWPLPYTTGYIFALPVRVFHEIEARRKQISSAGDATSPVVAERTREGKLASEIDTGSAETNATILSPTDETSLSREGTAGLLTNTQVRPEQVAEDSPGPPLIWTCQECGWEHYITKCVNCEAKRPLLTTTPTDSPHSVMDIPTFDLGERLPSDSEMLDWLEANAFFAEGSTKRLGFLCNSNNPTLRVAITAAMKAQKL